MKRAFLGMALTWVMSGSMVVGIEEETVRIAKAQLNLIRDEDETKQFLIESHDVFLNREVLSFATNVRKQLMPILDLPKSWRNRILFRIEKNYSGKDEEGIRPFLSAHMWGNSLQFQISASIPPLIDAEDFLRVMICAFLYEKILSERDHIHVNEQLPILPFWLVEGVTQQLIELKKADNFAIVRRTALARKTPTLRQILQWQQFSSDPLEKAWQSAFTAQLVRTLTLEAWDRKSFHEWLVSAGQKGPEGLALWPDPIVKEAWWQERVEVARGRPEDLVYSWDQTSAELAALQTVLFVDPQTGKETVARLHELESFRDHPQLTEVLSEKIRELVGLELRAHFAWRGVISRYRAALQDMLYFYVPTSRSKLPATTKSPPNYAKFKDRYEEWMTMALHEHRLLNEHKTAISDYLNWFLVTQKKPSESQFGSYFTLREQLEKSTIATTPTVPNRSVIIEKKEGSP